MRRRVFTLALTLLLGIALAPPCHSQSPQTAQVSSLKGLTLAQLGDVVVTTPTKEPEEVWNTAAAIFVLTGEEIRHSGATSIPEALRLVPGVEVARIDASQWAIGIRGFNGQFSQDVLVLIDGRSVYDPLFNGVFWDVQNVPLEDIDRIEVIRGPGGTIWGSNAVDGVINIITKNANQTKGTYASLGGGSQDLGSLSVQYGGGNGKGFAYRGYALTFAQGPEFHSDNNNFDRWHMAQAGFRMDWGASGPHGGQGSDTYSLQGDIYQGRVGELKAIGVTSPPNSLFLRGDWRVSGGMLLASAHHFFADGSDLQVHADYDRTSRVGLPIGLDRNTFSLDAVYHRSLGARNQITAGADIRLSPTSVLQVFPTAYLAPHHESDNLYGTFVQDQIALVPDKLQLTLGSKFEHNIYTGWETEPTARLLWRLTPTRSLWGAITRAVATPSQLYEEFHYTVGAPTPPVLLTVLGNPNFVSQTLLGYELGYRTLLAQNLYLDVATFYNRYNYVASLDDLTITPGATPPPPYAQITETYENGLAGSSKGGEIAPDWQPATWLRLRASYSYAIMDLHLRPGFTNGASLTSDEGSTPRNQVSAQAHLQLPHGFTFDPTYRYVGALPAFSIPSYNTMDARLAWHLSRRFSFSVTGQNLFQPYHYEFSGNPGPLVGVRRTVFAAITWQKP